MTNAEIVENARRILYGHDPNEAFSCVEIGQISAALGVARIVLRAQQEAEKNAPLTLDKLREMAQKCEGIYIAHVDGTPVFRGQKYCAAVLDFSPTFGSTALHIHAIYGDRLTVWEDDYGKTWIAYRFKPEERK